MKMKNIAHRGLNKQAPECTAPAFVMAKEAGYTHAENDMWFSKDGYPVMVHMRDVAVGSDGQGNVDELTLEELKSFDYSYGYFRDMYPKYQNTPMLTFEEWIALCKELDLGPYIDCKMFTAKSYLGEHGAKTCVDIVNRYDMMEKSTWIVGYSGANAIREYEPTARLAIIADKAPADDFYEKVQDYIVNGDPDSAILYIHHRAIDQSVADKCKAAGINLEAWVVAQEDIPLLPEIAVRLYDLGVQGIANDGMDLEKALKDAGRI